jgi:hypothetical protein
MEAVNMGEAKRRKQLGTYRTETVIPNDLKTDIAGAVQSIDFILPISGGTCLFRAMIGKRLLERLGFPAKIALGGMVYRVGPDPYRDVVAFCGKGNTGQIVNGGFLGHYWLALYNDFIDFSVAEWQTLDTESMEIIPCDLGPIRWTISPPNFFWANKQSLAPIKGQDGPSLGSAWYTGWAGPDAPFSELLTDVAQAIDWSTIKAHFDHCIEHYALSERAWAAQHGHTAIRLSTLCKLAGYPGPEREKCIVLQGKPEINSLNAAQIIANALVH